MRNATILCAVSLMFVASNLSFGQDFKTIEQRGQELFQRKWVPNDARAEKGDGLGPMFNENSCAKCHPNGGGAGRKFNVQLLSIRERNGKKLESIPERLNRLMPYFSVGGEQTVILHKKSTDEAYNHARRELLGLNSPANIPDSRKRLWENAQEKKWAKLPPTRVIKNYKGVELIVSERNTPALFGGGLIDKIPRFELDKVAAKQRMEKDGISGRVSVAMDGSSGKFGWRG